MHPILIAALVALTIFTASPPVGAQTQRVVPKLGQVTPSANAAVLAQVLVGNGVTISNAVFTGAPTAAGTFSGGEASVGIASGVVLATGTVGDVLGPNDDEGTSTDLGQPGDTGLDALVAPFTTQDATILEFDVTTPESSIGIQFVFASEEYNEYVDSPYNDVIAIYVNGINCANYAGKPVNVNSINAGSNPGLFIDNTAGARSTQMDGMTIPLECVAAVNPNVPNHVRIAIADTSDGILDAAVFLAAGAVRAPGIGPPTISTVVRVIEFYHTSFDHYFVTAIPAEIASLDSGPLAQDWTRTGESFDVYLSGVPGTAPVCRFFSQSFAPRSSHFYTPDATECAIVKTNPNWLFEAEVFNLTLTTDGSCPAGTQPLYRMYNNGMSGAPNHRYTTDAGLRSLMVALGWTPEGLGIGVVGCVPGN